MWFCGILALTSSVAPSHCALRSAFAILFSSSIVMKMGVPYFSGLIEYFRNGSTFVISSLFAHLIKARTFLSRITIELLPLSSGGLLLGTETNICFNVGDLYNLCSSLKKLSNSPIMVASSLSNSSLNGFPNMIDLYCSNLCNDRLVTAY